MGGEEWRTPARRPELAALLSLRFALDDPTLREAEEAALRFVDGPWCERLAKTPVSPVAIGLPDGPDHGLPVGHAGNGAPASSPVAAPVMRELWSNMSEDNYDGHDVTEPEPPRILEAPVLPAPVMPVPVVQAQPPSPAPQQPPVPQTVVAAAPERGVYVQPRTWANIVSKDLEAAPAAVREGPRGEPRPRRDSVIDCLLFLATQRAALTDGRTGQVEELPEELKRFQKNLEPGLCCSSRSKFVRRGMRNDANNCYVNVVIQSLLPCSALMQLLSWCAHTDPDRPFYTGMVRLCKEFHSRRTDATEAFNVLLMPHVKEIISTWQSIGAQQDAGEFLFYMLSGMHEECKWALPVEASYSSTMPADNNTADPEDWAQVGKHNRRVEVRSAGGNEDSPIVRIFGGLVRSSLRAKHAKADSVSLEPFNHLILDISAANVDSVWSALEVYCGAEAVNDGRATKRLQFKVLPKVLIVNFKRFSYNKDTGCPQKIKKAVRYEEKLTFDKQWLVDDVEPLEYTLTAVICHHGDSANGGHYNAAVRYNSDWFMYDDALVRQMDLREVLNQQLTAYLLVYQCPDKVDLLP